MSRMFRASFLIEGVGLQEPGEGALSKRRLNNIASRLQHNIRAQLDSDLITVRPVGAFETKLDGSDVD